MIADPSLSTTIAAILEKSIRFALKYDAATQIKLTTLSQQCIRRVKVNITEPETEFFFCIEKGNVLVQSYCETDCEVAITGNTLDFLSALGNKHHSFSDSNLSISGKISFLNQLKDILSELDIDWEEPLTDIVGVIPGHTVAEALRSSKRWLQQQNNNLKKTLPEYLVEEIRVLPSSHELQSFYQDVDELKSATIRAEAKIRRLQQNFSLANEKKRR